jgi:hypothetical protein
MTESAIPARQEFTDHFGTRFVWKEQAGSPAPALLLVHTTAPDGAIAGRTSDDATIEASA